MSSSSNRSPTVECRDLVAGYTVDSPVILGLSMRVEGPGLIRIAGRNGAGKSTLVEALSGYLRPLAGDVLVNGMPAHVPVARYGRRVCRTSPALYPYMNVEDHLLFASGLTGADAVETMARAAKFGLDEWLSARADGLSTGTARKLWYLMCTMGQFDVVVLDEPFNGLDEAAVDVISAELNLWSQSRLVLVVCHSIPQGLDFDGEVSVTPSPRAVRPSPSEAENRKPMQVIDSEHWDR